MTKRDFLALEQYSNAEVLALLDLAARVKRGEITGGLERKVLSLVFMDPSLRTRSSMEAAMYLHGGHSIVLEPGRGSWALELWVGSGAHEAAVARGRISSTPGIRRLSRARPAPRAPRSAR